MKYAENSLTELKEKLIDEVKKEITAFLNTEGGTIYVGVKDDGELAAPFDMKERDIMDVRLSNWIDDAIYPNASRLIKYDFNDDGVFTIHVTEGLDKPYYLKEKGPKPSGIFKRVGTTSRMATESEILLMLLDSRKYSYEEDVSDEQELTFHSFEEFCDENGLSHGERNMRSLRMVDKDGKFTNLGLLMSDQSPIVVKFAKYDKNLNFTTKKEYKGSLLKVLANVLENAANYNDVSAVILRGSWQRVETVSYPGASLREGILNAFCHCNYFIRSNIKVEFFDDKVRITNPGGIFEATLKEILDGVQTYRNPGLVNILNKLHYIENFGTGIPRIIEAYGNSSKKPIFDPRDNFFILTLPNLNHDDTVNDTVNDAIKNDARAIQDDKLGDMETHLLRVINMYPGLNTVKLTEKMRQNYSSVTLDIIRNTLRRKLSDYVEYRGAPRTGGFYVKSNKK